MSHLLINYHVKHEVHSALVKATAKGLEVIGCAKMRV